MIFTHAAVPLHELQALADAWKNLRQLGMARDGDDLGRVIMPLIARLESINEKAKLEEDAP